MIHHASVFTSDSLIVTEGQKGVNTNECKRHLISEAILRIPVLGNFEHLG